MGYFTETMNALLEFKSDIRLDNARKIRREKLDSRHYSTGVKDDAERSVMRDLRKPARNMDDYNRRKSISDNISNMQDKNDKENSERREKAKKYVQVL